MSPNEWLAIGMIVAFFVFLLIGIPVGISIAATAFFFGYIGFGPMLFNLCLLYTSDAALDSAVVRAW